MRFHPDKRMAEFRGVPLVEVRSAPGRSVLSKKILHNLAVGGWFRESSGGNCMQRDARLQKRGAPLIKLFFSGNFHVIWQFEVGSGRALGGIGVQRDALLRK